MDLSQKKREDIFATIMFYCNAERPNINEMKWTELFRNRKNIHNSLLLIFNYYFKAYCRKH